MDGVVNVFKPHGMTSHDVVAKLRKIYHTKKVGHTGTLDPDAIGVLPVCIGQGTRLVEFLTDKDKVYKTIIRFGMETDTQDISGKVIRTAQMPTLTREEFIEVTRSFIGEIEQVPPMYSAIKKDGRPLYQLAREGKTIDLEPRKVMVYDIKVLLYENHHAMLEVHCGKGTYIRTLCQDIARACHSAGTMEYLMRTKSGNFAVEDSVPLDVLEQAENPEKYVQSMEKALQSMACLHFAQECVPSLQNGMSQQVQADDGIYWASDSEGNLQEIGQCKDGIFKPHKVFKASVVNEGI